MSLYRPEFEAALSALARLSDAMAARGLDRPVLVGGGAVEIYTLGAVNTGDFDLVTGSQQTLEAILQEQGFVRPTGTGVATRGWIHPDLKLGFEIVSATLLDGQADRERVRPIILKDGGIVEVIAIDMIADRMGQYASGTARDMLAQARALYRLSEGLDLPYMEKRIRYETAGDYGVEDLQG